MVSEARATVWLPSSLKVISISLVSIVSSLPGGWNHKATRGGMDQA